MRDSAFLHRCIAFYIMNPEDSHIIRRAMQKTGQIPPTPNKAVRIGPDSQPVFPCWLCRVQSNGGIAWSRYSEKPVLMDSLYHYWHPDSETALRSYRHLLTKHHPDEHKQLACVNTALTELSTPTPPTAQAMAEEQNKVVGTGFYRDAAPGTFGPNEWLDLLMACQDGRATCLRVMEYINRETMPVRSVQGARNALDELANNFLRWPLPRSVCADPCATKQDEGRVGTNLLSFVEARQMMADVVLPVLAKLVGENGRLESVVTELTDIRVRLNAEAAELRGEVERLAPAIEFARCCLQSSKEAVADESMSEQDEETMECAARLGYGNVRKVQYDPKKHGEVDCEPGSEIWFWGAPSIETPNVYQELTALRTTGRWTEK